MLEPRLDLLPAQQRALWAELSAVPQRFVLYGGTAVALRLGHRESVDFDFFASSPLGLDDLLAALPWLRSGEVTQQQPDAFGCIVERLGLPVRLAFFGGIGTGRVGQPDRTRDGVPGVAAAFDLLGHKLKVILQRAEGKDYQDIAALLAHGLALSDGLGAAATLFPGFPVMESVRALGYRADLVEPHRVDDAAARRLDRAVEALPDTIPTVPLLSRSLAEDAA